MFGLAEQLCGGINMKITAMLSILFAGLNVLAWGAPDILPATDRTKVYELETKLDKKKSFQKISIWAAKTFTNANETIKLKDADAGILIAKGNLPCTALKIGNGYADNQHIDFTLEITADNKKTEVKISDLVGRAHGAYDDGARPSKKEEMEAALKECIQPFVDLIKADLK